MIDTSIPKAPFPVLGESLYADVLNVAIQVIAVDEQRIFADYYEWAQRQIEFYVLRSAT